MRFIGIDLHHDSMTIAVIDQENKINVLKIKFHTPEFSNFIKNLTNNDYIAVEASTNTFWLYDQINEKVAHCFVVNTWKFLDIFKTNKMILP